MLVGKKQNVLGNVPDALLTENEKAVGESKKIYLLMPPLQKLFALPTGNPVVKDNEDSTIDLNATILVIDFK
jgi:hypothetical protein